MDALPYNFSGRSYEFDLDRMVQTNTATGTERRIRPQCQVPNTWTTEAGDLVIQNGLDSEQMWVLEEDQAVRDLIARMLRESGHRRSSRRRKSDCFVMEGALLCHLWRIENFALWHKYAQHARSMEHPHGQDTVDVGPLLQTAAEILSGGVTFPHANERWLLHGTGVDAADLVVAQGFDHRCATEQAMYGRGTYFAAQSCKVHQYTCPRFCSQRSCNCDGSRYMILARTVLGTPHYATEVCRNLARPPAIVGQEPRLHDSIVARPGRMTGHHSNHQDHWEFVLFQQDQAYPAYVIEYQV